MFRYSSKNSISSISTSSSNASNISSGYGGSGGSGGSFGSGGSSSKTRFLELIPLLGSSMLTLGRMNDVDKLVCIYATSVKVSADWFGYLDGVPKEHLLKRQTAYHYLRQLIRHGLVEGYLKHKKYKRELEEFTKYDLSKKLIRKCELLFENKSGETTRPTTICNLPSFTCIRGIDAYNYRQVSEWPKSVDFNVHDLFNENDCLLQVPLELRNTDKYNYIPRFDQPDEKEFPLCSKYQLDQNTVQNLIGHLHYNEIPEGESFSHNVGDQPLYGRQSFPPGIIRRLLPQIFQNSKSSYLNEWLLSALQHEPEKFSFPKYEKFVDMMIAVKKDWEKFIELPKKSRPMEATELDPYIRTIYFLLQPILSFPKYGQTLSLAENGINREIWKQKFPYFERPRRFDFDGCRFEEL